MRLARNLEAKTLIAKSDSKLVNNEYQARDPQLSRYKERAVKLVAGFERFELIHVPREQNERVDLLAKLASTQRRGQLRSVIHENLEAPTIDREELQDGRTNENEEEARRMTNEAAKYTLVGQRLYKRGFAFPLLKCLD
ncbi:hypothetical protein CR513_27082, partial [Mucuna pruriens]